MLKISKKVTGYEIKHEAHDLSAAWHVATLEALPTKKVLTKHFESTLYYPNTLKNWQNMKLYMQQLINQNREESLRMDLHSANNCFTRNDLYDAICMARARFQNLYIQIWRDRTHTILLKSYHTNFNAESCYDFVICKFRLVKSC